LTVDAAAALGGEGFLTPVVDDGAAGLVEPNEGAREARARAGVVAGVPPAVFSLVAERAGEAVVFRPKEEVVVRALAVEEARGRVEGGGGIAAMEALKDRRKDKGDRRLYQEWPQFTCVRKNVLWN